MARDRTAVRPLSAWVAVPAVSAVAVCVVVIVVVNGFRLVATETFVRAEYRLRTMPPDVGLGLDERRALALVGLESIRPRSRGGALLEEARLPDGEPAFAERELAHMDDVRVVLRRALQLQTALAFVLVAVAVALARTRGRSLVPNGLIAGGIATVVLALALVPVIVLGFDTLFERFHGLFFEGDSWRFARTDTLLRIYPDRFWEDTSAVIAALVVGQAALAAAVGRYWHNRVRPT